MNVLLTGASGFIGGNLLRALRRGGHTVRPVSRRHGLDMRRLLAPQDWQPLLDGVDAVVNAAGILAEQGGQRHDRLHTQAPVALFRACGEAGVRRIVQVSALGADATATSSFHRSKHAADEALLALGAGGVVLRPGLVYGRGGRSAALLLRAARLPRIPVLDDGRQPVQPVHVSDVVAAVLRALEAPRTPDPVDVVGPRTLHFADWMQALRAAQGLPPARLWHVPHGLAAAACRLARPCVPLATPEAVHMLRQARAADARAAQRLLGRALLAPRPDLLFEDASILWRTP